MVKLGVRCQETDVLVPDTSFDTTLKTNRRISNKKFRIMKCGIASGFAFGYDPTHHSIIFSKNR